MIARPLALWAIASLALATPAAAEIAKTAFKTQSGLEAHWWPQAMIPPGWHVDVGASRLYNCKAMAPDELTFETAQTVIYACARRRGRDSDAANLSRFIKDDQDKFRAADARLTLERLADDTTADGRRLQIHRMSPGLSANWEIIAYGEERGAEGQDYFLTFVISARSTRALSDGEPAFRALVRAYR